MMVADNMLLPAAARLAAPNEVKLLVSLGPDGPDVMGEFRIQNQHEPGIGQQPPISYRIISRFWLLFKWGAVVLYDLVLFGNTNICDHHVFCYNCYPYLK